MAPAGRLTRVVGLTGRVSNRRLMERGFAVHSINPKQVDRFRDRHSPAGAQDGRRDARVPASALRTDPHCLRRLSAPPPELVELRELSRLAGGDGATFAPERFAPYRRTEAIRWCPRHTAAGWLRLSPKSPRVCVGPYTLKGGQA